MKKFSHRVRIVHRYLGYFVAGLMTVYTLTGMILLFRDTHFLKNKILVEKNLDVGLSAEGLDKAVLADSTLNLRNFKIIDEKEGVLIFDKNRYNSVGAYDQDSGELRYYQREYPFIVDKFIQIHKSKVTDPYSFINILSGLSLLLLILTSFWMFVPHSHPFKKGIKYVLAGIVLAALALFL